MDLSTLTLPPIQYQRPMAMSAMVDDTIVWQKDATNRIIERLDPTGQKHYRGVILRGSTGLGKMYITANAIREMHLAGKLVCPPGSMNPIPVLWICPKSLKIQTQRTLKEHGIAHLVMVMSYGQIKNADGTAIFLSFRSSVLPNGQMEIDAEWNPLMIPALVVCDEIQKHKNWDTTISNVIVNIPDEVLYIGMSATPGQRVSDFKVAMVRCGVVTSHNALPCTKSIVGALAREIAAPKHPDEYSPSAVERLREALDDYIVELKGVRFKHQTRTICASISFRNAAEQAAYQKAYDDYIRELWEIKRVRKEHHGVIKRWVAMQKFQQRAEFIRCGEMAERALQRIKEGKQVIIASNYVETLRQVWRVLRSLGFDEQRLSFVVGSQTENNRQEQVDKFQRGDSDVMLFTMKSGGVGLSMHHDRPNTRPRHIILPPTWSAIDLVQALGRGHRLTSLSPTVQEILWYRDTVEDRVKEVVERKAKCIAKSVTAKEQFMTIFEKSTADDVDMEESDEINQEIAESQVGDPLTEDVDTTTDDDSITGEGLDSSEDVPCTFSYR